MHVNCSIFFNCEIVQTFYCSIDVSIKVISQRVSLNQTEVEKIRPQTRAHKSVVM